MSTCGNCGTPIEDGAAFCANCGSQTGDPTAATVAISAMPEDPLLQQVKQDLDEDYEVEKELGRGGMAVVYKGKERMLERIVAIKVLPPEMARSGDTAERFKREARLAASLDHPNIIPIYRVGQKGELYYMAMKFVEGRALDAVIEDQGALPLSVTMTVLEASAMALAFAHDREIVHRDIKGGNILIDTDGRVMVSDFGIARALSETSLTASGMVIGTPNYMSPEQCGGLQLGPQSDQYSLGIQAFQMLTGQLPFEAESIMGVIQHHYLTPPPDITEVRKSVPEPLLDVIYQMLEKKPENRFKTTHDLVDALAAIPDQGFSRREGLLILKQLSTGEKIDMVRTGSLPPLKLADTAHMPAGLRRASKALQKAGKKKSRVLPILVALVVIAAAGAGAVYQFVLKPAASVETAAPAETPPAAPAEGLAVFTGLPDGATINIGGTIYTDQTITLPPNTYEYTVRADGYQDFTATVTIAAGQDVPVRPVLEPVQRVTRPSTPVQRPPAQPTGSAPLRVATDPVQAEILVDGQRVGTGRYIGTIDAGTRRITVRLAGYVQWDSTITVVADQAVSLGQIRLTPEGGP